MADDTRQNEETLWVLRAQTGDLAALESLLARVEAPLYRYVATLVGEPARAADVLQETFFRIWRKLVWLRDPSLFRPWAFRIASREAFRSLSRDRRWSDMADGRELEGLAAPEPQTLDPGLRERLAGFVRTLSPASRAVILLVYFEDFTLVETAAYLECRQGPCGTARLRARQAARPPAGGRTEAESDEGAVMRGGSNPGGGWRTPILVFAILEFVVLVVIVYLIVRRR